MIDLKAYRKKFPEYDHIPDETLLAALQKKAAAEAEQQQASQTEQEPQLTADNALDVYNPVKQLTDRMGAFSGGSLLGLKDLGRGAKQAGMELGEKLGLLSPGGADDYTQQTDMLRAQEQQALQEQYPGQSLPIAAGRFAGGSAPFMAIPGLGAASVPARMAAGAGIGAGTGAAQYIPEGGVSRAVNTVGGGLLGGAIPPAADFLAEPITRGVKGAAHLAGKGLKNIFPDRAEGAIGKDVTTGINIDKALQTKRKADKLGVNITPAEASGSEAARIAQRSLGFTKEGQEKLSKFLDTRKAQEERVIRKFLHDVSPSSKDASNEIRAAAKKILKGEEMARAQMAKPFYERAFKDNVPLKKFRNLYKEYPVILRAYNDLKRDPAFVPEIGTKIKPGTTINSLDEYKIAAEMSGDPLKISDMPDTSIKMIDLIKRKLGDRISSLKEKQGNKARLITKAQKELVDLADEYSSDYRIARSIFSKESAKLNRLKESEIKRIADLPDDRLQQVSRIIFDRNETNPQTLARLRDEFIKKDKDAWRRIFRNEIERRINLVEDGKTGSKFYNAILAKDADFNQFVSAAKGMPEVQKKLVQMRPVFKNLINTIRDKDVVAQETGLKSIGKAIGTEVTRTMKAGYDEAAIKLITSNNWDKQLKEIMKIKSKPKKRQALIKLLDLISERGAERLMPYAVTNPSTPELQEQQP